MDYIKIGDKEIGPGRPCYIIAEAGVNHNGSMDIARKLVDVAVDAGVDAVKFQTFKAEGVSIKSAGIAPYQKITLGIDQSQQDLLRKYELTEESLLTLKDYCDNKGITFLCTPHSSDYLAILNRIVPAHKIGSGDLINILLLERIAMFGKPMILGTGMADLREVREALEVINNKGNYQVVMLHCTTNYPCQLKDVNLRAMNTMIEKLPCYVGYSDHTEGIGVPIMAVTLGARVLEKHFTLDKMLQGPDHKASLNPKELKSMVRAVRDAELSMGSSNKTMAQSEIPMFKIIRKSVVSSVRINEGEIITEEMLTVKRPGVGLHPRELKGLIGKRARRDIAEDSLITEGDF